MNKKCSERHHKQIPSIQRTFLADVEGVVDFIEDLGNPFSEFRSLHLRYEGACIRDSLRSGLTMMSQHSTTRYQKTSCPSSQTLKSHKSIRVTRQLPVSRQGCTFHVKREEEIWIRSLKMRTMIGHPHWLRIT